MSIEAKKETGKYLRSPEGPATRHVHYIGNKPMKALVSHAHVHIQGIFLHRVSGFFTGGLEPSISSDNRQ